ncbi:hypothetical protein J2Z52_001443 [Enterococcus rivorum]|nr:hypothetical protein [Enterococcus rivorum]
MRKKENMEPLQTETEIQDFLFWLRQSKNPD